MIVTVRVPDALIARLDKVLARLRAEVAPLRVSRADVLRHALELGTRELERRKRPRRRA